MLPLLSRSLPVFSSPQTPPAGRSKTAPLFVPDYRSASSIRVNARPPGHGRARRELGRLIEARRKVS
ncbi:hypothetical protein A33M_0008 [Rhodovulum sp. PH10]|nr:hypothetical protein A33M_0008 [Rhodovulum sp. PH10]